MSENFREYLRQQLQAFGMQDMAAEAIRNGTLRSLKDAIEAEFTVLDAEAPSIPKEQPSSGYDLRRLKELQDRW